jgi:IclR family transcriptional regulator, acetate operon repressor
MGESSIEQVPRGTLGTVRNAVLLLNLLSEGPAYQQLSDLAERSGLSLPTVHRLLRSLGVAGLVEQDPVSSRYGLGAELVRLSERYLTRLPVSRAIAPFLVELRNSTKATVLAAVLARGCVIYVDRVDGDDPGGVFREPVRMRPALESAAGRLLSARGGPETWREALVMANGQTFTGEDRKRWAEAAFVVLIANGASEVAVPIMGANGSAIASLAATGDLNQYPEDVMVETVAPKLARAAAAASRFLSHG